MKKYEAGIIGVGALGGALLGRYEGENVIGITRSSDNYLLQILQCKIILLCMKQGDILSWLDTYSGQLSEDQRVISFGAGLGLKALRDHAGGKIMARAMTNRGIAHSSQDIPWTSGMIVGDDQIEEVNTLFSKIGNSIYLGAMQDSVIDKETHKACDMGRIAYILEQYKLSLIPGLRYSEEEADLAIKQSLSAVLEAIDSGEDLSTIATRVASRRGITEASNKKMRGIKKIFRMAMKGASAKMKELNQTYI